MIEVYGDLWEFPADARVITTNGFVKADGELVMGAGCAKEAKERYPGIAKELGDFVKELGNRVFCIITPNKDILYTFPVKKNWRETAQIELIESSCIQLVYAADTYKDEKIVMPRPGCGNGKLNYQYVKPILEKYLDDRFYVITNEN